jgi:hypothetical protein
MKPLVNTRVREWSAAIGLSLSRRRHGCTVPAMTDLLKPPSTAVAGHLRACLLALVALAGASACGSQPSKTDACTRGQLGCACTNDKRCTGDLTCSANMCFAQDAVSLVVLEPRARGCEVLLVDAQAALTGVDFGADVRGTSVTEAPRTAVVFIAGEDTPIEEDQVTLRFKAGSLASPQVSAVSCTDANGAPIAGAKVEIRG